MQNSDKVTTPNCTGALSIAQLGNLRADPFGDLIAFVTFVNILNSKEN